MACDLQKRNFIKEIIYLYYNERRKLIENELRHARPAIEKKQNVHYLVLKNVI